MQTVDDLISAMIPDDWLREAFEKHLSDEEKKQIQSLGGLEKLIETKSAVFVIVFSWNEFLFAFIFTATRAKTAPLVISEMIGSIDGVDWGILFAASTIQLAPVLAFVMFMNRYLVAGLTAGATKG